MARPVTMMSVALLTAAAAAGGGDCVLLALPHSAGDEFSSGETSAELLSQAERKAACKKIRARGPVRHPLREERKLRRG